MENACDSFIFVLFKCTKNSLVRLNFRRVTQYIYETVSGVVHAIIPISLHMGGSRVFPPPLIPVWSRRARTHHPGPLRLLSELLFSVFEWQLVKRHWLFRGAEPRQSLTSNSGNKSRCVRRALIRSCTTVTGHDKGACCDIARLSCLFL